MIKFIKKNIFSCILIASNIIVSIIIIICQYRNDKLWEINTWSLLGSIASIFGLAFVVIQLYGLSKQTDEIEERTKAIDETYKKTISDLENRDMISNISTALQKIEAIKTKIREGKINDLLLDLSPVAKLLVTLQESFNENFKETYLEKYKITCNELEIKILLQESALTKNDIKDEFIALSQLELVLTEIQSKIRYNKKISTNG